MSDNENRAVDAENTGSGDTLAGEVTSAPPAPLVPAREIKVSRDLTIKVPMVRTPNGQTFLISQDPGNLLCLLVGSRQSDNLIRRLAYRHGATLTRRDLNDVNDALASYAEAEGLTGEVWYRVAPISNGVEIDLGNDEKTRARITAGKVEIVTSGSPTFFYRTPISRPMVHPAVQGDLGLLNRYLNLHPSDIVLLKAWITFTLAHPKKPTAKYPILLPQGEQGSGKSFLCHILQKLVDPNSVGVQILPANGKDLAIAAQNCHVLAYDNVRTFKSSMADLLCIAATGGSYTSRQLYTDADQAIQRMHVALVLNGIHDFVNQPDLAQRCLPIELRPIPPSERLSEIDLMKDFERDLPAIQRGIFDLIAGAFQHLPDAEIVNHERMIDFVRWLAAIEKHDNAPAGTYQAAYSYALQQVQRDTLLESPLAATIITFMTSHESTHWSGTPTALLAELNSIADPGAEAWRYWPRNSIALSKRLKPLIGGLRTQGIHVELGRGKERKITITVDRGLDHD